VADRASRELISLPLHPGMAERHVRRVSDRLIALLTARH
jgi:dTDP-4-amino-4,6-dideoxygalactose transaminase